MRFDVALQKLNGQSVGGQLIVQRDGKHLLVGRHHDGQLIVAEDPAAQALVAGLTDDPLDHDNDGKMGGSIPKRGRGTGRGRGKAAQTPADPSPAETGGAENEPETATRHEVVVQDETVTADQTAG